MTIKAIGGVHHDRVAFVETETVKQSQESGGGACRLESLVDAAKVRPEAAWCDGAARTSIAASLRPQHGPRLSSSRSLRPLLPVSATMGDEISGHEQAG